jgi:hypothetical protein
MRELMSGNRAWVTAIPREPAEVGADAAEPTVPRRRLEAGSSSRANQAAAASSGLSCRPPGGGAEVVREPALRHRGIRAGQPLR